ncbi:tRNA (N(6)-L-threonylcarbamoyladenosine(37)-C(2))-methylthiotransferase MtaB [bacterium]|nr:tRNA (N(6)-L-threonylcarbamoyladenosine(37)-C(2))-methylthiotransferase MtaB [bacterium]
MKFSNQGLKKSLAVATLGCKVNQYESQAIKEQFQASDFTLVNFSEKADVYVINTCMVTKKSEKESRQIIKKVSQKNKEAKIIITGCYARYLPEEIFRKKGVLVVDNQEKDKLFNQYQQDQNLNQELNQERKKTIFSPQYQQDQNLNQEKEKTYQPLFIKDFQQKSRALVKVQDGCNNSCSYCLIPHLRGSSRSRLFREIEAEVKELTQKGFKEIVLTGINLGQYGKDFFPKLSLAEMIKELCQNSDLLRIRLSSINFPDIDEELIDLMAKNPKVCKHFHIPLQSGSGYILKQMARHYSPQEYEELVNYLREKTPEIGLTTDILVGFPGEEESHFQETYHLVKRLQFSRVHLFKYSPRPQTKAYLMPSQVEEKVKQQRSKLLHQLSQQNKQAFLQRFKEKKVVVLIEEYQPSTELYFGYSSNYFKVGVRSKKDLVGEMVEVIIKEVKENYGVGEKA